MLSRPRSKVFSSLRSPTIPSFRFVFNRKSNSIIFRRDTGAVKLSGYPTLQVTIGKSAMEAKLPVPFMSVVSITP